MNNRIWNTFALFQDRNIENKIRQIKISMLWIISYGINMELPTISRQKNVPDRKINNQQDKFKSVHTKVE